MALALLPERPGFGYDARLWEPGRPQRISFAEITPRPSTHLAGARALPGGPRPAAYSLDLRAGGRRIVYSGDLGTASDLAWAAAERCDLLVCEILRRRQSQWKTSAENGANLREIGAES